MDVGTVGGDEIYPTATARAARSSASVKPRPARCTRSSVFVWTAADGMVEMPSLGRLDAVWTMSANGPFADFSSGKKSVEDQHAVLWAPAALGGVK